MAPQQLASAVVTTTSPYTGPRVDSVEEVIERLDEIQHYAEAHELRGQHDGVACFSYLYHRITTRVLEGIASGRFDDGEFVRLLDVVFANRYWTPSGRASYRRSTCPTPGRCSSNAGRTPTSPGSSSPQPG